MMNWLKELERNITAKTSQVFLLNGNVADDVLHKGEFSRLYQFIPEIQSLKPAGVIVFFNLASGVRFPTEEMKKIFLQIVIKPIVDRLPPEARPDLEEYFEIRKDDIKHVLSWFDALLRVSWKEIIEKLPKLADFARGELQKRQPEKTDVPFAVTVFEYQESKTPPDSATGSSLLDRKVVETFQWWAQFPPIKSAHNLIILVSNSLANIAPQIRDQTRGVIPVEIPLPNMEDQKETILAFESGGLVIPVEDITVSEMAKLTSGLSRVELRQIFKKARAQEEKLTSTTLFEKKASIIQARLGDMVRIRKPPWGWEAIGGMDDRVVMAMIWAEAMRRGDISLLPKGGILLTGAPGTGKTVFVEAFAKELDISVMEMMNTFNQFVGVSEQNMQDLVETAWAQRPIVLFIDEIDQILLSRDNFWDGAGGTFSRSNRTLMQFFSDPKIHGQVLVFAATNRPDLLDPAMVRAGRFGAVIPFPIPGKEERISIWKALLRKEVIRLGLMNIKLDISQVENNESFLKELSEMIDFWEKDGQLVHGPVDYSKIKSESVPLTGAQMEDIIGLSLQPFPENLDLQKLLQLPKKERFEILAKTYDISGGGEKVLTPDMLKTTVRHYLPPQDVRKYNQMNDLALLFANDDRFIRPSCRERARELRARRSSGNILNRADM